MAIGTMTVIKAVAAQGPVFMDVVSLVLDGSYPTGGMTGVQTAYQALAGKAERVIFAVLPVDGKGYQFGWDDTNDKLLAYHADYDAADGPLVEVPNATDLDGVTAKLLVMST